MMTKGEHLNLIDIECKNEQNILTLDILKHSFEQMDPEVNFKVSACIDTVFRCYERGTCFTGQD